MVVIQKKVNAVVKSGVSFSYDAATFDTLCRPEFKEIENPEEIIDMFREAKAFAFDTETTRFNCKNKAVPTGIVSRYIGSGKKAVRQDYPFCISFSNDDHNVVIYDEWPCNKLKKLAPLFNNHETAKVAHNLNFDRHMLENIGVQLKGTLHDTSIITKMNDENRNSFKLMDLAAQCGGIIQFEYIVDNYKKVYKITDYADIPRNIMTQYSCADTYNAWRLFKHEYALLQQCDDTLNYYETIERPLLSVVYDMERRGMKLDMSYEEPLKEALQTKVDTTETRIYGRAGRLFNINSTAQIHKVLMELGVDMTQLKYTEKGNPKLDKDELARLSKLGIDIIADILEYRKATKLLTTYATGIYDCADANGYVHASLNQSAAETGRFSVTKPALQTLGKKDTTIRKAFVPTDGYNLVFIDLDSIEYKLYAHYARIDGLIKNITEGFDAHTSTAGMLYDKPLDEVTKEERSRAKTINFALLYGSGNAALAGNLGISVSEAGDLKRKYFGQLPGSREFVETVQAVTKSRGYVKMFLGRYRRLKPNDCYKAVNSLMQGSCATYIKRAMIRLHKFFDVNNLKSRMVMTVHDELVFEIHKDEMHIVPQIRGLMEDYHGFRLPITAGVEIGKPNWGDKEDYNVSATLVSKDYFEYLDGLVI